MAVIGPLRVHAHRTLICRSCWARLRSVRSCKPLRPNIYSVAIDYITKTQIRGLFLSQYKEKQYGSDAQVHPLGDFYADLLEVPIPTDSRARADLPTFVNTGGDLTKEERAAKLFGNIKGSGYERKTSQTPDATWRTINGVAIPPRPEEPQNCCMSGCVHCVWDDYRDDLEDWAVRLREAKAKSVGIDDKASPKVEMSRPEVLEASSSMDDDGGGSESLWTTPNPDADDQDLFAGIPVGIREFMATEKRIRDRKKAKVTAS